MAPSQLQRNAKCMAPSQLQRNAKWMAPFQLQRNAKCMALSQLQRNAKWIAPSNFSVMQREWHPSDYSHIASFMRTMVSHWILLNGGWNEGDRTGNVERLTRSRTGLTTTPASTSRSRALLPSSFLLLACLCRPNPRSNTTMQRIG